MACCVQVCPVIAADALRDNPLSQNERPEKELQSEALRFDQVEFDPVREGYLSLSWNSIPVAVQYQLRDDAGGLIYEGPLSEAFVSGLADGTYRFHVTALDATGHLLATSDVPATVHVEHWSLPFALSLFSTGLVVFLVLVGLLRRGSLLAAREQVDRGRLEGEP
jgi:hypothetical protein